MVNAIAHLIESCMSATLASWVRRRPPKRTHNSMVYSCGIYSLRRRRTKPPVPCLAAMQSMAFITCFTIQHWHIYWSKRSCLFELHHINTHISRVHPWANNRWWIIQSELVLCFVIKRKFWFGELCDKSLLRRNSLKHNSEVLGEPERHYK